MNGAESLVRTLLTNDVNVCFANPGTSEMHFVAALDRVSGMRCVLNLFEGGATGAADGYWRVSERVSVTLMHLGPGLGNGWANLHNARKAHSGLVNIVGDHATWHIGYESPLKSDIAGIAGAVSQWVHSSAESHQVATDGAAAVHAARQCNGQIATLILPTNTAWEEGGPVAQAPANDALVMPSEASIAIAAQQLLRGKGAGLLVGESALRDGTLELAGQIAAKTGCDLYMPFLSGRIPRGAGRIAPTRLSFANVHNLKTLAHINNMVIVGTNLPVSAFAFPNQPSTPFHPDCAITELADVNMDLHGTLLALADAVGATNTAPAHVAQHAPPALPTGALSAENLGYAIGALLPENAIVVDESITTGRNFSDATRFAAQHDWLPNTGMAIGQGLPVAVGAAVACPDRKVLALVGDGSAMYTIQSLWTMARENLDVLVVIFANNSYEVLKHQLRNVGVEQIGETAASMLEVSNPSLDWQAMAKGHGVPSVRVTELDQFINHLRRGLSEKGPFLIEVAM